MRARARRRAGLIFYVFSFFVQMSEVAVLCKLASTFGSSIKVFAGNFRKLFLVSLHQCLLLWPSGEEVARRKDILAEPPTGGARPAQGSFSPPASTCASTLAPLPDTFIAEHMVTRCQQPVSLTLSRYVLKADTAGLMINFCFCLLLFTLKLFFISFDLVWGKVLKQAVFAVPAAPRLPCVKLAHHLAALGFMAESACFPKPAFSKSKESAWWSFRLHLSLRNLYGMGKT
mmetsp:Transcript_2797/g.3989  ORF Transcript_2797/g.3989 Transcript_2797/m.3989 type:complete len:230 (-) Transcript_2797:228-917(-)